MSGVLFFVFGESKNGVDRIRMNGIEATRAAKKQYAYTLNNTKRIGNKKRKHDDSAAVAENATAAFFLFHAKAAYFHAAI